MREHDVVRVSLPRHVYVILGVFGVLMLGTLVTLALQIEDQRSTIDKQLEIAARQSARALPLIDDTQPLVERLRAALPEAAALGKDVEGLTAATTPLMEELRDSRGPENLRAAGTLAAVLLESDVGAATQAGQALAAEVLRAGLPGLVERVGADLPRVTEGTMRIAEIAPDQLRLLRRSVSIQEQSLATQRETLALLRETLGVGRETLGLVRETERHAESLDNKTGGSAPPVGG